MLRSHIRLSGSLDATLRMKECVKCGQSRSVSDGVESGPKFVCGSCWRKKGSATLKFGAKK